MSRNQIFETVGYPLVGTGQEVAYTGTAGSSSAVGAQTRRVWVWVTTVAYVAVGQAATTADMPLPANTPVVLDIRPGQIVSAIQSAAGGNLYVCELSS